MELGRRAHSQHRARRTRSRAVRAILKAHRAEPFDVIHSIWSGACDSSR